VGARAKAYRHGLLYSDLWESYQKVSPEEQHQPVGKSSGQTNYLERWTCTLVQRLGRFVRKRVSLSKSKAMHEICLVFLARLHAPLLEQY
jgi:IS1 family transposase